jgi:hypothetical protein
MLEDIILDTSDFQSINQNNLQHSRYKILCGYGLRYGIIFPKNDSSY